MLRFQALFGALIGVAVLGAAAGSVQAQAAGPAPAPAAEPAASTAGEAQAGGTAETPSPDVESVAKDREAKSLFLLGGQAYAEARYESALKSFQESYELSGRPALLYNIGLTLANLRRDQEALDAFEKYLADVPDAPNRDVVENRIAILRNDIEKEKQRQNEPLVAPTPAETAQAGATSSGPDYRDEPEESGSVTGKWWFWAGIGGAIAAGVVVGVLVASGGGQTLEGPVLLNDMTRVREL